MKWTEPEEREKSEGNSSRIREGDGYGKSQIMWVIEQSDGSAGGSPREGVRSPKREKKG